MKYADRYILSLYKYQSFLNSRKTILGTETFRPLLDSPKT